MTHRFPVKEIARQAGMSTATVDRVLNNRANVSPQTRRRVQDALRELEAQEGQLAAKGRRLFLDVVMEAPQRFSRQVRQAAEATLEGFRPVAIRPRFTMAETMTGSGCAALLEQIRKKGSQGVCLKARDTAEVRTAIESLRESRIPVVTIFTDLPGSGRLAYAGLDNESAGRTAAYLLLKTRPPQGSSVLITLSQHAFQGEEDRFRAFRAELSRQRPDIRLIDASGGGGLHLGTAQEVGEQVRGLASISCVYSMGGGNRGVLQALEAAGHTPEVFIAHDLDDDNLDLLRQDCLTFVLHHDLKADMHVAFGHILAFQGIGNAPSALKSDIQIVTPANIPSKE
ncbi:LacI family transcriptional regulator [Rhodobacterales bacterium]|nr:LacI family transcriptional regulator [Rhodobacterales bacterium]